MAEEMNDSGSVSAMRKIMSFQSRLMKMDQGELIAALDEIESLDLTEGQRTAMIGMILDPLSTKDPELVLTRFSDRLSDIGGGMLWRLSSALGNWAKKDGVAAAAWLDKQIEDGVFISKSLDGRNQALRSYEGTLFTSLLGSHPDLAEKRIAKMSAEERQQVFSSASGGLKVEDEAALAEIARMQLGSEGATQILVNRAANIATMSELKDVDEYIESISATPEERKKIVEQSATSYLGEKSYQGKVTAKDVDDMRDWLSETSPDSVTKTTGEALGELARDEDSLGFEKSAALALRYHEENGDDDLLTSFLDSASTGQNKEEARAVAEKISDPAKRKQALDNLK